MSLATVLRGPRDLRVEEEPDPDLAPGQVRMRTLHSGVSAGTELTAYRGTNPYLHRRWDAEARLFMDGGAPAKGYPLRDLGYEEVGEVIELGPGGTDAGGLAVGDRVYGAWGHRTRAVLDAAYARERRMPAGLDALAGIFSHIGSTALNGVHDAGGRIGETAVVFGLGIPGQIAAQLLARSGLRVVGVDLLGDRIETARGLGAVDLGLVAGEGDLAARVREVTEGRGADVAIEASGAIPALHEAVRSVAYSARVVALGFYQGGAAALALGEEFHHNRVTIVSSQISGVAPERSYRWTRVRLARETMRLQAEGHLDLLPLIRHRLPLRRAAEAFRMLDEGEPEVLQIVLDMPEDDAPERGAAG